MSDVPQFLRVIKTKALFRNKILIPKKIVRKCGESLTDQACFRLPYGFDWKIGLTKSSDGKVWIDKGWPEFLKHYSIDFGHFLVFEYQGNSRFNVAIFDKATIEIEYKSFGKEVKEVPKDNENMDTLLIHCPLKATEGDRLPPPRTRSSPFMGTLTSTEKSKALKRISSLIFNDPFFILHIQPSHVQAKPFLPIPLNFAKSYIGTGMQQMILKVGDRKNKSWCVMYNFKKGSDRARVCAGWKAFAQDNALKRGDLCVFGMTKINRSIIFVVSIYRENKNADSTSVPAKPLRSEGNKRSRKTLMHLSTVEEDPKGVLAEKDEFNWNSKASEAASKLCSKHPLFQVDFPSSSLEMSTLSIPVWFARSYLEAKEQGVSLEVGQRSWDVGLEYHLSNGYSLPQFRRGWFVFVNENSLAARDSCIFELIQSDPAVFKVSIFRDQV